MVNNLPYRPTLFCLKITGPPGVFTRIKMPTISNTRDKKIRPKREAARSKRNLKNIISTRIYSFLFISLAGIPTTIELSTTDLFTKLQAPIATFSPTTTPSSLRAILGNCHIIPNFYFVVTHIIQIAAHSDESMFSYLITTPSIVLYP